MLEQTDYCAEFRNNVVTICRSTGYKRGGVVSLSDKWERRSTRKIVGQKKDRGRQVGKGNQVVK